MPNEIPIPHIQPANMEEEPLKSPQDSISTKYAKALVMETFHRYENFRTNNHDKRWNVHDELYFGVSPSRVWEGTTTPRANISRPITFDQVESMVPAIYQNIFNIGPEWFQVAGEAGVDPTEAKQTQDVMSYYLEHPADDSGVGAKAEITLAIKDMALHGNGGIYLHWDVVNDRPNVEYIDIRDVYVDPGCKTPSIDSSRSIIVRKPMTVDELLALRDDPRMDIPDADTLYSLSRQTPSAHGDQTKQNQVALRGISYNPISDTYAAFPSDRLIEVLIYYSKSRIIWILNREWIAYNAPNPYRFIPFCFSPCYTVLGQFYAQSIADVQENNQRYIGALLNARLDELSLQLHPPRAVPRGSNLTPNQLKWRPGAVYQFDDPKDATVMAPAGATTNIFTEIAYLETGAEKSTGLTGLSGGVPRPSNANRTMGGMQIQLQGSGNRLSDIVANVENYLIVPMLYKLYQMIKFHKQFGDVLPAYNSEQGLYGVPASTFYKKCRFRMNASSRMVTRDKLLQIFPFLAQFILQGPLVEQMQRSGRTVDFGEILRMLQDATSIGQLYRIVREITPEEKQMLAQPDPKVAMEMQKAQLDSQTKLQVAQIAAQPNPAELEAQKIAAQLDMQKAQQELQIEREKAQMEMFVKSMLAKIKVQGMKDEAQAKMMDRQAQMQMGMVEGQQKLAASAATHQMNLQQTAEKAEMAKKVAAEAPQPTQSSPRGSTRTPKLASKPVSRPSKAKKTGKNPE